jgi:hypothetical protein
MDLELQTSYMDLFPFEKQELEKGLKYLGGDWKWLISKLEKC